MICLLHRCPIHRHHRIADILIQCPARFLNNVRARGQIFIEELNQLGGDEDF